MQTLSRSDRQALSYFLRLYRKPLTAVFSVTLVSSVLEALQVGAFYPVFQVLSAENQRPAASVLLLLVAVTLVKAGVVFWREALVARVSGRVQHDLKSRLMELYSRASLPFFFSRKQGQMLYNLSTASTRVGVLAQKYPQGVAEVLKVAAIGLLLLAAMPLATLGLAGVGLFYYGLTHFLSQRVSYHTGKGRVKAGEAQSTLSNEFLTGIRQILAYGTQRRWLSNFVEQSRQFRDLFIRDAIWLAIPKILLETGAILLFCLFLLLFGQRPGGALVYPLSSMGFFAVGLFRLLPSLTSIGQLRMEIASLLSDARVLQEALTETTASPVGGNRPWSPVQNQIGLDQLCFSYSDRAPLFDQMTLSFEKGKVTAMVGSSGGGKSTLAYLLLGLLQPTGGRILVDGIDLREFRAEDWKRRIGFVGQELFLLHGSIRENLLFGRSGFSNEAVERAARLAHAHDFIQALPQAYETVVGERGMKLSGGQQQRLAIARAVLHDPEILLLDEATSFLDTESERLVQRAVAQASKDRTVILIAHRLSTVRSADRIVVLEKGRVVEEGRHEDLLREGGRYAQLLQPAEGPVS